MARKLFYSVYVIRNTCFDECFFILSNSWKAIFCKGLSLLWSLFRQPCWCAPWRNVSKEARILRYPHNNITILIPKFKHKVNTCKLSLTNLIFRLRFLTAPHFSLKMTSLINSKPLRKHVFSLISSSPVIEPCKTFWVQRKILVHVLIWPYDFQKIFFANRKMVS